MLRRSHSASRAHTTVDTPSTGTTETMAPSATLSASFSGVTPCRSSWSSGETRRRWKKPAMRDMSGVARGEQDARGLARLQAGELPQDVGGHRDVAETHDRQEPQDAGQG